MKFKKQVPSVNGYYWYIDNDYPVPSIGFVQDGNLHDWGNKHIHRPNDRQNRLRIGDMIETPDCRDNEIE